MLQQVACRIAVGDYRAAVNILTAQRPLPGRGEWMASAAIRPPASDSGGLGRQGDVN
jgi:hypothetical protein